MDYTAAWVPEDELRSWDDAAHPAIEWVLQQAEQQKRRPILVTPTQHQWNAGTRRITWFANNLPATTPRSKQASSFRRPALAFVPDYETMELAMRYANGSSLAVIETRTSPLIGWAMEMKALDLVTSEVTPDTRSEYERDELERLHFYGNNGWSSGFGKDQGTRILRDLIRESDTTPAVILGYMLAKGHSSDAITGLAKLIRKLRPSAR